jgi:hypothetical protein
MLKSGRNRIFLVLLIIVALFASGFRLGHPQDGLKNALGSAKSGIVFYKTGADLKAGAKVMVKLDSPAASPVLAMIVSSDANGVQIQTGANPITVKSDQVYGKLIAVIPYIGFILSLIGL